MPETVPRLHPRSGKPSNEKWAEWADEALAVFRQRLSSEVRHAHSIIKVDYLSISSLIGALFHLARKRGINLRALSDQAQSVFWMEEQIEKFIPRYYQCGICNHYHPAAEWNGDCRDDANRFRSEQLDERHGADGWVEVPMPGV